MSKLIVTANALNVRSEPSLNSNVIGLLNKGEIVDAMKTDITGYWQYIKFNETVGWASFKYLQILLQDVDTAINAPWLEIAKNELGQSELTGSNSNPRIVEYLKSTNLSINFASSDETPWCSGFVNFCVEQAGYAGTDSASALSWERWGIEAANPRPGDIAVFERGARPHGHVAFFISRDNDTIQVLGGNQSNKVCYTGFPAGSLISIRSLK